MSEEKGPIVPSQYFNLARVSHSKAEFFIDFGQVSDNSGVASLIVRLVTNPISAKEVFRVLRENVERYEATFGVIASPKDGEQ